MAMDIWDIAVLLLAGLAALPFLASDAPDSDAVGLYTREELLKRAEEWAREKQTLRILVVGETGIGKSTLIKALFGMRDNAPRRGLFGGTKRVTEHHEMINGVFVSVFGLQDIDLTKDSIIINDIKVKTKGDIDLLLFCIDMSDTRFRRHHIEKLQIVTVALGESIWERALVVLTRANRVVEPKSQKDLRQYFIARVSNWERNLTKALIDRCNITIKIVMKIPVVPAGFMNPSLPDRDNWLGELWVQAFWRLKSNAMIAFLKAIKNRLRHSIGDMVFKELWSNPARPIILSHMSYPEEAKTVQDMNEYGIVVYRALGELINPAGVEGGSVMSILIEKFSSSERSTSLFEGVIIQSLIIALEEALIDAVNDAKLVNPGNLQEHAKITGVTVTVVIGVLSGIFILIVCQVCWRRSQGKKPTNDHHTAPQPNDQLGVHNKPEITEYLARITNNRDLLRLGEGLGLTGLRSKLNTDTFLDDLVGDWLERKDRVDEVGKPTWRKLVEVLRKVEQNGLANDIEKEKLYISHH